MSFKRKRLSPYIVQYCFVVFVSSTKTPPLRRNLSAFIKSTRTIHSMILKLHYYTSIYTKNRTFTRASLYSFSVSLSLSFSFTYTHTIYITHSLSFFFTFTHTLYIYIYIYITYTHTHTLSLSLSLSRFFFRTFSSSSTYVYLCSYRVDSLIAG